MEDQFAKKNTVKAEKVAKNEIQRMRNIVKAKKGAIPRTGYLGPDTASSSDVSFTQTILSNQLHQVQTIGRLMAVIVSLASSGIDHS